MASMIEYLPVDLPIANETAITSATAASEQPSTARNMPVGSVMTALCAAVNLTTIVRLLLIAAIASLFRAGSPITSRRRPSLSPPSRAGTAP